MKDENKTKKQLISELVELRRCIAEFEESKAELKRAEAGLVKEKNFADTAINSLPGIFYLFDENGRIHRWNRNVELVTGYSAEEISKMIPLNFFVGEEKKLLNEAIQEAFIKGQSTVEAHLVSKDGRKTPYFFSGLRFISDNQNYIIGMGIDITKRKQAEDEFMRYNEQLEEMVEERTAALRIANEQLKQENTERRRSEKALEKSKELYQKFIDSSSDDVLLKDENFKLLIVNKSYKERMSKYGKEILGKTVFDLLPLETAEGCTKSDVEALKSDSVLISEEQLGNRIFETRKFRVNLGDDKFGVGGYIRDITEHKRAEETLRGSEERYRHVVENAPDIIYTTDTNGNYQFANSAGLRLTDYTLKELQKLNYVDLVVPEYRRRMQIHYMRQYLKKVPSTYFEFPLKVKSGDVVWLGQTSSLIIKQDTVNGFHLVARDITEFKKVDEELKKSYEEILARQNAMLNLSEDLLNEVEEKKAAEEKIREYSNQLRHLASQMSLLEERERCRIANMLHDSIGQNLALSKILLDELQAANPSGPLSLSLDELNKIIDEAINSTRNLTFEISSPVLYELGLEAAIEWLGEKLLRRHNILFDFRNDRNPKPLTKEAKVLLFQAVREFYLNIIKHSKAHHVRVIIQELGSNIHISIEDDGIGFDTKTLHSQVSESFTYGLFSVCERIALIGGSFGIESTPGQGTRVTLIAPLAA